MDVTPDATHVVLYFNLPVRMQREMSPMIAVGSGRGCIDSSGKGILLTPSIAGQRSHGCTPLTYFFYNKRGYIKANCWYNPLNEER